MARTSTSPRRRSDVTRHLPLQATAPYLNAPTSYASASGIALCTWLATVLLANALRHANRPGPAETLLRRLTYRPSRKQILSVQQ
ncbi:DUF418 domain-containing protein [Lentzea flaviverrucosa]|uniref:DUF418 domain-containing protein n=1 Tax=Lentzea flaviverrucosa TaxID=200379 RepID=UPI000B7F0AE0|nr:DUF418 domain-containing protein [Lentzea flaviverrucosa]